MKNLHERQREILEHLFKHPEGVTLDELAARLGVTRTAAKQHLVKVQDLGYVAHADAKGTVGRPLRRYLISEEGIEAFPKKYSWLSNVILAQLAAKLGAAGSRRFMRDLAGTVARSVEAQLGMGLAPAQRLKKVTELLNELGYRASLKMGARPGPRTARSSR